MDRDLFLSYKSRVRTGIFGQAFLGPYFGQESRIGLKDRKQNL